MMLKFNKLEHSKKFISCAGSPKREVFHGQLQPSGEIILVSDGFEDIQEYIDSFALECDINNIIMRVAAGEIDLLNKAQGVYMDTIGLPNTYAQVLQTVIDGQRIFESLPLEIKQKFDNDFNKWFVQMDQLDWLEKTGFAKNIEKEEEVKTDES